MSAVRLLKPHKYKHCKYEPISSQTLVVTGNTLKTRLVQKPADIHKWRPPQEPQASVITLVKQWEIYKIKKMLVLIIYDFEETILYIYDVKEME